MMTERTPQTLAEAIAQGKLHSRLNLFIGEDREIELSVVDFLAQAFTAAELKHETPMDLWKRMNLRGQVGGDHSKKEAS